MGTIREVFQLPDELTKSERDLWSEARSELLTHAVQLDRTHAGITAGQIRMAIALADRYTRGSN